MRIKEVTLVDIRKMSEIYPGMIEIPTDADIDLLLPGDFIKVSLFDERVWAEIITVEENGFIAVIDNYLTHTAPGIISHGDLIKVSACHIYAIL